MKVLEQKVTATEEKAKIAKESGSTGSFNSTGSYGDYARAQYVDCKITEVVTRDAIVDGRIEAVHARSRRGFVENQATTPKCRVYSQGHKNSQ